MVKKPLVKILGIGLLSALPFSFACSTSPKNLNDYTIQRFYSGALHYTVDIKALKWIDKVEGLTIYQKSPDDGKTLFPLTENEKHEIYLQINTSDGDRHITEEEAEEFYINYVDEFEKSKKAINLEKKIIKKME